MKIVDKINEKIEAGEKFFSFEFFPPKTEDGVKNLHARQERMAALGPTFCDITWGAGGSTADLTLTIATDMQNTVSRPHSVHPPRRRLGTAGTCSSAPGLTLHLPLTSQLCLRDFQVKVETMMHLTCTNMPVEKLEEALQHCKAAGITNILALRGDPPHGQDTFTQVKGGFACALDLVKYIREKHGDDFGICVSGYPEAHPDVIVEDAEQMKKNYWADIEYLRQKVEAGADFIVTQLFYDVDAYLQFVKDCRSVGITAPILPGIMPIMAYGGFKRMTSFCKTRVPQHILDTVEAIKENDEAVKAYGISLGTMMCQRLLAEGAPGVHMYTLNLDRTAVAILRNTGLLPAEEPAAVADGEAAAVANGAVAVA